VIREAEVAGLRRNRLLAERALPQDGDEKAPGRTRPARSVTVNLAESPLGWLRARGLVTQLQFEAGERLRGDWERSQLEPSTTMRWDAAPTGSRRGVPAALGTSEVQIAARSRFEAAVAAAGPGLSDIVWRIVCAGEGMRDAERALGWPARAGRVVLCMALDRLAAHYRMR
jgi:hypothetical protein